MALGQTDDKPLSEPMLIADPVYWRIYVALGGDESTYLVLSNILMSELNGVCFADQTIYSSIFCVFIEIPLSFIPKGPINKIQHYFTLFWKSHPDLQGTIELKKKIMSPSIDTDTQWLYM